MTDSDSIDGLSNWDRWGADDELDTLNLITDEVRARAAAEARTGRCVAGEAHRTGGEGIAASQRLRRYLADVLCAGARLGAPSAGEAGAPAPSGSAT